MKTKNLSLAKTLALAAAALLGTIVATQAQTPTPITSLPYTINSSGTYVLNANLNSTQTFGNLITVNASNVTIDFQGHYIAGAVNNTSQTTIGINAYEQSNLAIRNGTIAFCKVGIVAEGSGDPATNSVGHRIDNMRVTYCYTYGIASANNQACRITNCQVSQCSALGIFIKGAGTTASSCVVSGIAGTTLYGISAGTGSFIRQNTVSNCTYGVSGGKYQDNLTANCTTPYSGGIDAGGNN